MQKPIINTLLDVDTKMPKQQLNLRVSDLTLHQLKQLMEQWGTSQTETVTVIIDRAYIQERNKRIMSMQEMTDDEIDEELRQLEELEDGEEVEHPDTQFSDYPETTE